MNRPISWPAATIWIALIASVDFIVWITQG